MTRLRNLWGKLQGWGGWRRLQVWLKWSFVALFLSVVLVILVVWYWDWLWGSAHWLWGWAHEKTPSNSETLRNLALALGALLAAFIGLPLAVLRSVVAHRQAETSERGLRNERYQKGADMLGSATPATRMGGIYALERLAREHPKNYHVQIMQLLCAFVKHPTEPAAAKAVDSADDATVSKHAEQRCPTDVKAAARAVGKCRRLLSDQGRLTGIEVSWKPDLSGTHLSGADLSGADLSGADLSGADLSGADLRGADLRGANLRGANLRDADLSRADLRGANLRGANLRDADLSRADLSRADLSRADLSRADLRDANLSGANLTDANLSGADLLGANLTDADLSGANLYGANLYGANLSGPHLGGADLTKATLSGVTGLTKEELRSARPSPPPESLPEGLVWPFEKGEDDVWRLKPAS
ncbi:MAG: pentapeptide repeat-containing protein [Rhodospirillales bacterium]|nr:pentapeptide repeat-containing protein [Rhodospirillales bacterium]